MTRNTYVEIDLSAIGRNVKKIINAYPEYEYYFGVVKADGYGHGIKLVDTIIDSGVNYLAVATLDEALIIRENNLNIPILCLGYIPLEYLPTCEKYHITVTIPSLEYAYEVKNLNLSNLKLHIKIDTGMHRLGISDINDYMEVYDILKDNIEGVYTHIYDANNLYRLDRQYQKFEQCIAMTPGIKIVHLSASDATFHHDKKEFENGIRLGINMYGLTNNLLDLESTFALKSEVIQIHEVKPGDTVGYGGAYEPHTNEFIAVIPIGYADGIIRKNTGRDVFINGKKYPIVGNICMDMMFVRVDNKVKIHDVVDVIKDNEHIMDIAEHLETIPYEIICDIGKRVNRIYKED